MSEQGETIRLILPPAAAAAPPPPKAGLPRTGPAGEQLQSGFWTRISLDKLKTQIGEMQGKITSMVGEFAQHQGPGMKLEEVTIGLSISVDGDIGIASAGAEASIELSFKIERAAGEAGGAASSST
jgi:hypothetical protein